MGHWTRAAGVGLVAVLAAGWPVSSDAQVRTSDVVLSRADAEPDTSMFDSRFEMSLGARLGVPSGYVRAGENGTRGSRLRLSGDLGVKVSEAVEADAVFRFSPKNAIRATALYYFLRGEGLLDRTVLFNNEQFTSPGHASIDADFYRLGLAYERTATVPGGFLTGSLGLTYVHLSPKLSGHGRSNTEDFSRAELPVPIVGLRFDIPMGNSFAARAAVSGGGLPRVNSLRKENGSTVYLEQIHGDAEFALTYAITKALVLDVGPHLTYFFQHEKSQRDDNAFELIDYGLRVGLTFKF
jgi:hypothetical protein